MQKDLNYMEYIREFIKSDIFSILIILLIHCGFDLYYNNGAFIFLIIEAWFLFSLIILLAHYIKIPYFVEYGSYWALIMVPTWIITDHKIVWSEIIILYIIVALICRFAKVKY